MSLHKLWYSFNSCHYAYTIMIFILIHVITQIYYYTNYNIYFIKSLHKYDIYLIYVLIWYSFNSCHYTNILLHKYDTHLISILLSRYAYDDIYIISISLSHYTNILITQIMIFI